MDVENVYPRDILQLVQQKARVGLNALLFSRAVDVHGRLNKFQPICMANVCARSMGGVQQEACSISALLCLGPRDGFNRYLRAQLHGTLVRYGLCQV